MEKDVPKKRKWKYRPGIWEHVAVRPTTFMIFREMKKEFTKGATGIGNGDDAFIGELLRIYKMYLVSKAKKVEQ